MRPSIESSLTAASAALAAFLADPASIDAVEAAGGLLVDAVGDGRTVFSCGNGGSMCDAMHFAEELSGRYRRDRRPLPALAISDPAHLSCTANDFGYDAVFSRFIEAHGRAGDVLIAISTSGSSANVVAAAEVATRQELPVIALTGRPGSPLGAMATVDVCAPAGPFADRVQEIHIVVLHTLVEVVERALFPENYADEP